MATGQEEYILKNEPLSSGEQGKIFIFTLLMILPTIFIVASIPAIILIFGLVMMKRNDDFSHIESSVKFVKGYFLIMLILAAIIFSFQLNDLVNGTNPHRHFNDGDGFSISAIITSLVFLALVHNLYLIPMRSHSEWVVSNGIFSKSPKSKIVTPYGLDIIKGEKLKHYSVADELLKWAKLKEDGHITEEEFNEARKKLLDRA